jgi:hypothetical protein
VLAGRRPVQSARCNAAATFARNKWSATITYELRYDAVNPTQSHIHFGQRSVNGGISVFLCSNLGNGPAGTQACPPGPATIGGTLQAANVIGPAGQGITAGQFDKLLDDLCGVLDTARQWYRDESEFDVPATCPHPRTCCCPSASVQFFPAVLSGRVGKARDHTWRIEEGRVCQRLEHVFAMAWGARPDTAGAEQWRGHCTCGGRRYRVIAKIT